MPTKTFVIDLILIIAAVGLFVAKKFDVFPAPTHQALAYEVHTPYNFKISLLASNLGQISRLRMSPDGTTLLVGTLAENIYAFRKQNGVFVKQEKPFFNPKTNLPGFPPEESGLSGIVFGADFEMSKDLFLLHAARTGQTEDGDEILKNRITRLRVVEHADGIYGEDPMLIFEGNVSSQPSHQIQGGTALVIQGKAHLMFNVGDTIDAQKSHDLSKDAGKVMLIQRDGSNPLGPRPYPESPNVQAVGLRNAYDIVMNPYDPEHRFAIGDTGTDRFDRLLYGKLIDMTGETNGAPDLKWDGTNESLEKPVPDVNLPWSPEMVLHRWDPTQTVNDIVFYPGGVGGIPASNDRASYALLAIWGKTGSTELAPGKEILLATFTGLGSGAQPVATLSPFIVRAEAGRGKIGHPLGVAVDPTTKTIFFGDILEGNLYKVEPQMNSSVNR